MIKILLIIFVIFLVNYNSWYFVRSATLPNFPQISLTTADLDALLDAQWNVIQNFDGVIRKRRHALNFIKSEIERIEIEHLEAKKDFKHYSGNPINAFTMIKRMKEDIDVFKMVLQEEPKVSRDESLKYPSKKELHGAVRIILRLQRVYKLNITELAGGLLKAAYSGNGEINQEVFFPMTASDCFEISKVMYENNEYEPGIPWLMESLRLYKKEKPVIGLNESYIMQHIRHGYEVLNNKHYGRIKGHSDLSREEQKIADLRDRMMKMLCRDELDMAHEIRKNLKCWYSPGHRPFSRLARFRAEQVFVQPDITLIHDALSFKEMASIGRMAMPQETTDKFQFAKTMTLSPNQTHTIPKVIERIKDMTGVLDIHTPLLVANYGVGGQFKCHLDNLTHTADSIQYDNRITVTTIMFYLTDVEQGGATVFPLLTLKVFPIMGAALTWSNHLPSGQVDQILVHGACPVLRGTRWTAAQLINDADQKKIKPCTKKITSRLPENVPLPIFKNLY